MPFPTKHLLTLKIMWDEDESRVEDIDVYRDSTNRYYYSYSDDFFTSLDALLLNLKNEGATIILTKEHSDDADDDETVS